VAESDFLKGKKVLIVDDEPDVIETLVELLPACEIVKASSFGEGKRLLESQYFDLAILDIMGVDGFKLLDIANERKVISVMLTAQALSVESTIRLTREAQPFSCPRTKWPNSPCF